MNTLITTHYTTRFSFDKQDIFALLKNQIPLKRNDVAFAGNKNFFRPSHFVEMSLFLKFKWNSNVFSNDEA